MKKEDLRKSKLPLLEVETESIKYNQVNCWYSNEIIALVLSFKKQF